MLSCFHFSWFSFFAYFNFSIENTHFYRINPVTSGGGLASGPRLILIFSFFTRTALQNKRGFYDRVATRVLVRKLRAVSQKHDACEVFLSQRYHLFEDIRPDMIVNSLPASCSGSTRGVPFSLLFCFANFLWHSPWYSVATFPQALSRRWRDFLFESKAFSLTTRSLILDPWSIKHQGNTSGKQ